jgi:hypothetical protein
VSRNTQRINISQWARTTATMGSIAGFATPVAAYNHYNQIKTYPDLDKTYPKAARCLDMSDLFRYSLHDGNAKKHIIQCLNFEELFDFK